MRSRTTQVGVAAVIVVLAVGAAVLGRGPCVRVLGGGPQPLELVPRPLPPTIGAERGLKMAFIGDSGTGESFEQVLRLIRREHGDAVVHMGDATYDRQTPEEFWGVVDRILGHDYPYFLAEGNHDQGNWSGLSAHGLEHVQAAAVTRAAKFTDARFDLVYKGVSLLFLGSEVAADDPKYIVDHFSRDPHIWKICSWHKNQRALQVGGKGNAMGWGVYEACRQMGALIETGHEHSYHRTKTLTSMIAQEVDTGCNDPRHICVRPGAVPVFVSGLGGRSIRTQQRCLPATYPYGCRGEWAFVYTSTQGARYGALFIAFGENGDPRSARGYFKNVENQVVDEFSLTAEGPGPRDSGP
jgi:hypothetical protein